MTGRHLVSTVETNPDDFADWVALHALLNRAFADMVGRIDPPSSLTTMGVADVAAKAREEDLYLIRDGARPVGCAFGHTEGAFYEVGKMAVAATQRKRGLARRLIDTAAEHARSKGFSALQLYARVELLENHAVYCAMGFEVAERFTHPGFERPTALIFRRAI